jgi:hypothetical protein
VTRDEYFTRQRGLARSQARAEYRQAVLIRRLHREFYAPLIEAVGKGENPQIDKQALAGRLEEIIRTESVKPAEEAEALQAEMEASLLGKVASKEALKNAAPKITDAEWKRKAVEYRTGKITAEEWFDFERKYYAERQAGKGRQSFRPKKQTGRSWAVGVSPRKGVTSYRRDPETGKIIWDTTPIEWIFSKRYDLSASVWAAVGEEEQGIFTIVRTGRALGRDVKDIAKDLEAYINFGDGGKRVMARWNHMFPNTEKGRREAWKRQYLADHPGPNGEPYQMFTEEARETLRTPEAKAYLKEKTAAKTKIGTPLRPDVVKEYHGRLGAAGIDYRTMRIMRTETAVALAERQETIARNSDICTGMVDWILQKGRDGWNCKCAQYAAGGPYEVDRLPGPVPLHPNCFLAGTMVIMADKTKKAIETIKIGQHVISRDEDAGALSEQRVTATMAREYRGDIYLITLSEGNYVRCTPDHQIYSFCDYYGKPIMYDPKGGEFQANTEKREARLLSENQFVLYYSEGVTYIDHIIDIRIVPMNTMVYNITVEKTHNYFANNFLVSNCNCQLRPHLKSKAEIDAEFRRRTAADDEIIKQRREQGA